MSEERFRIIESSAAQFLIEKGYEKTMPLVIISFYIKKFRHDIGYEAQTETQQEEFFNAITEEVCLELYAEKKAGLN